MIYVLWVPYHHDVHLFVRKADAIRFATYHYQIPRRRWWKTENPKIRNRWNATDVSGNQFILLRRTIITRVVKR